MHCSRLMGTFTALLSEADMVAFLFRPSGRSSLEYTAVSLNFALSGSFPELVRRSVHVVLLLRAATSTVRKRDKPWVRSSARIWRGAPSRR